MFSQTITMFLDLLSTLPLILVFWISFPPTDLFTFHPLFVSLGMLGLMPWGARILDRQLQWIQHVPRTQRLRWHWIIQLFSGVLTCLGVAAVFANKVRHGKPHFTTWHAFLGLVLLIYVIVELAAGVVLHWKLWPVQRWIAYGQARRYHMYAGLGLFALATGTFILGFRSIWFKGKVLGLLRETHEPTAMLLLSAFVICGLLRMTLQVGRFSWSSSRAS
ncbi:Cytochrome b561 domain-containing protein 2 [Clonorchis sinensis]|uniref:ascorbate ferrireductase (transmembrane) n=1 Tax=Clonorchis sinensis TaxID=79923 RepID=A0A8T1M352_CLOSI|nr:Cytochrome b561 domain-containing protein 2 [Clonorchis sinensis]